MKIVKQLAFENKQKLLKLGNKWIDTGYLLTQENGLPMHPDSITDYCRTFEKKYNEIIEKINNELPKKQQLKKLPHINPHAFRHSQASILLSEGIDIVTVSKRLGHSKVSTTNDFYLHLLQKADKTASEKLDNIFKTK